MKRKREENEEDENNKKKRKVMELLNVAKELTTEFSQSYNHLFNNIPFLTSKKHLKKKTELDMKLFDFRSKLEDLQKSIFGLDEEEIIDIKERKENYINENDDMEISSIESESKNDDMKISDNDFQWFTINKLQVTTTTSFSEFVNKDESYDWITVEDTLLIEPDQEKNINSYDQQFSFHPSVMEILNSRFEKSSFRPYQFEVVNCAILMNDIIVSSGTYSGKSVMYQVPIAYLNGIGLVISPLLALIREQSKYLNSIGLKSVFIVSEMQDEEKEKMFEILLDKNSKIKYLYLTPEMIENEKVQSILLTLYYRKKLNLIAIDEAQCIYTMCSFRPSYLKLGLLRTNLPKLPIIALTASGSQDVLNDIEQSLMLQTPVVVKGSLVRKNITYNVHVKRKTELTLKEIFDEYKSAQNLHKPTIVFCKTIRETEKVKNELKKIYPNLKVTSYHSDLESNDRVKIENKFFKEDFTTIVCTIAFSLGVNKANVKNVLIYGSPKDIEEYQQQSGRAGRNDDEARVDLVYSEKDRIFLLDKLGECDDYDLNERLRKGINEVYKFAMSEECLRIKLMKLLKRFDEDLSECGKCSVCMENKKFKMFSIDKNCVEEGKLIVKVLNEYKRKKLGKTKICNILSGSKSKSLNKYFKQSKHYGKSKLKQKQIEKVIRRLVFLNVLKETVGIVRVKIPSIFGEKEVEKKFIFYKVRRNDDDIYKNMEDNLVKIKFITSRRRKKDDNNLIIIDDDEIVETKKKDNFDNIIIDDDDETKKKEEFSEELESMLSSQTDGFY